MYDAALGDPDTGAGALGVALADLAVHVCADQGRRAVEQEPLDCQFGRVVTAGGSRHVRGTETIESSAVHTEKYPIQFE
ncbi:unannotated protein [freshwater metagenome]|uniref:Unannotated protein n=1 Tax=freshwater metagenome TaxID=449393 RepID=A0A6J7F4R7_9ZZZZ